jgi:hypothetical protein
MTVAEARRLSVPEGCVSLDGGREHPLE